MAVRQISLENCMSGVCIAFQITCICRGIKEQLHLPLSAGCCRCNIMGLTASPSTTKSFTAPCLARPF